MSKCRCNGGENIFYFLAVNEDGWKCVGCDAELGFRPDLDVDLIGIKVGGILHDLADRDFIGVSNGTMGDVITANVVKVCEGQDTYDQYSIIRFILADANLAGHASYWREQRNQHGLKKWPPERATAITGPLFS